MGGIMDYKARFYSPAQMRFLQPDSIIPDQFNPQAYNRFSYVFGNPISLNDPSGNIPIDCYGTNYCGSTKSRLLPEPYLPPKSLSVEKDGEGDCSSGDNNCGLNQKDDETDIEEPDFHLRLGNEDCDIDCQHTLEGLFVFGAMMDSIALGLNFGYALTADIAFFINPAIYAGMVIEYQWFSTISNTIGSVGGLAWIASGFVSGENYIEVAANNGVVDVSGSVAQDTIATILFDGAGWVSPVAREPNGAVAISGLGVLYDLLRNPFEPILPTFFQPTFSFTIDTNSFLP